MFKHNLTPVLNKQRPDKNGCYPLRIRATVKRKVSYFPTGIMLKLSQWDEKKKEVINHAAKTHLNLAISNKISAIEKSIIEKYLTGDETGIKDNSIKDFIEYGEKCIKRAEGKDDAKTTQQKRTCLAGFQAFKSKAMLAQVNAQLLYDFESYLRGKGYSENTVWKYLKTIKHFILSAYREGLVKVNPLNNYTRVKYVNPVRQYLTAKEIGAIEKLAEDPHLGKAANWFLFSVYSGLRYSDAAQFSPAKIVSGKIVLRTEKTGGDVSIKVHPKLKAVIKRLQYPIYSNPEFNRLLKAVGAAAGLNKKLTTHLARHTNAVMFLERGGSMEVLSKLLGHASIRTTSIYAKITDKRIDAEVGRVWG